MHPNRKDLEYLENDKMLCLMVCQTKYMFKEAVMSQAFNPSIQEAEAGRSLGVPGQPGQYCENVSKRTNKQIGFR